MIINDLRNYIRKCPYLKTYEDIIDVNVNYLSEEAGTYTIEEIPGNPVITRYLDGSCKKQFQFIFASREFYDSNAAQNIEKSCFYENFSRWLLEQNNKGILPIMEGNKVALKIEAVSSPYIFQSSEKSARYQIQCRLIYMEGM